MKYVILCFLNVLLTSCGQILFKYTARGREITSVTSIISLLLRPSMILALAIYAGSTFLWVYILSKVLLSYAYPIQALAFPIVTLCSLFIFKEIIPAHRWIGIGLIVIGAFVSSR